MSVGGVGLMALAHDKLQPVAVFSSLAVTAGAWESPGVPTLTDLDWLSRCQSVRK